MKKCKACQKEIDPKAKICPYCRSKQTSKAVSVISGIISIVVIIWVLGLIFGGSKSSSVNNTPALSSNGNSNNNVTTAQQSNSPSHDDLMKQNNPDIKHISTLTSDYLGKSFVLYANVEVGNYYNYGFNDENSYYSLKLWDSSVGGDYESVYGYIVKTNPNSKALVEKILNGSSFLKINASIPSSKYEQGSNAFLQIDSWEEVK